MKPRARNIPKGLVKSIKPGPVSILDVLEISPGVEHVSAITAKTSATLQLLKGQSAYAANKASSVLIGVDE